MTNVFNWNTGKPSIFATDKNFSKRNTELAAVARRNISLGLSSGTILGLSKIADNRVIAYTQAGVPTKGGGDA
jgi:hypothetical protein